MTNKSYNIPYVNLQKQCDKERDDLTRIFHSVIDKANFVGGEEVEILENNLKSFFNVDNVIALNSGTDALMFSMYIAGISHGDEVITCPNSFVSSASSIINIGAKPVFVDVGDDQNIDPSKIEAAITKKTKAIMPIHLTGRVCEMDKITTIAKKNNLIIIEDSAQSIGSKYNNQHSGTFGDFGCFSTHPLKNLNAIGDGGFVVTNNIEASTKLRQIRNHGMIDRVTVSEWGWVSRMDSLQAAVLNYRLLNLQNVTNQRRKNAKLYSELLENENIFIPKEKNKEFNTYHTFVIQCKNRDKLQSYLSEKGIKTSIHYPMPIHLQPAAKSLNYKKGDFPVTEKQATEILTLPVNEFATEENIYDVSKEILKFYE